MCQFYYSRVALVFFFFKQKTAYEMRISDWSSDVCSSDLLVRRTDSSGNGIAFAYDGGRLTLIRDAASQQELRLSYAQVNGLTRAERLEARPLAEDAAGRATATLGDPLRLVKYDYDGQGRLISVTRHLAPNGGGIGGSFVTTYVYGGLDSRIAGVAESDGTGRAHV